MASILIAAAGLSRCPERDLTYQVERDLVVNEAALTLVSGENGSGKTSFFERVLLPNLARRSVKALYLGSDQKLLESASVAWLALRRLLASAPDLYGAHNEAPDTISKCLCAMSSEVAGVGVLVLDDYAGDMPAVVHQLRRSAPQAALIVVGQDVAGVDAALPDEPPGPRIRFVREGAICRLECET